MALISIEICRQIAAVTIEELRESARKGDSFRLFVVAVTVMVMVMVMAMVMVIVMMIITRMQL